MNRSNGFTLVEMATVLVIIGLILGMAFKGKDLIDGAKVKSLGSQINKIQAGVQTYYERYGQYPGDGCTGTAATTTCAGAKDGIIVPGGESDSAWNQLTTVTNILTANDRSNIFGSLWQFWGANNAQFTPAQTPVNGTWVTNQNYTPSDLKYVCAYDQRFDDGTNTGGNVRHNNAAAAYAYQPTTDCWAVSTIATSLFKLM